MGFVIVISVPLLLLLLIILLAAYLFVRARRRTVATQHFGPPAPPPFVDPPPPQDSMGISSKTPPILLGYDGSPKPKGGLRLMVLYIWNHVMANILGTWPKKVAIA
ncbi:unnamed protein product [Amaranthus hypochondriacus]